MDDLPEMPEQESEFANLMAQLRAGDQEAAWKLIEIYGPHIHRVVRRDLHQKMRSRFDSTDFVQAVWASFFRQSSHLRNLRSPEELLGFLVTVARNKVVDETRRRFELQKGDITREEAIEELAPEEVEKMHSPDPRPSQVAVAREQCRRLCEGESENNRQILELRFSGATYEEIGKKLKLHERSVRRTIEQIFEKLEDK